MASNKWLITRDGFMLKSEISVIVPQLNQDRKWNVVVINKQGIQMTVIANLESINQAMAVMDKIIQEIDKTDLIEEEPQEEIEEEPVSADTEKEI